jgi:hypothetical protein
MQSSSEGKSSDTSHLYEGKTVRSAAPSRKKLAGKMSETSEVPKDAVPEIEVPSFIESLLGGPIVPKMKFLPADKMVQNLQLGTYGVLIALGILTYIITPALGTIWYSVTGSLFISNMVQLFVIITAVGCGFWGTMSRDARYLLMSYLLFVLSVLRFASSKVSLSQDPFGLAESETLLTLLVVAYAVLLVMFFELSNGVLRFSMLDTSIRTNEVYVMNVKRIASKYHRSLIVNPVIAAGLAFLVLSANRILPWFIALFSEQTALRMEESVELISVYGVALGTLMVFTVVGGLFALDLPTHMQNWRENKEE